MASLDPRFEELFAAECGYVARTLRRLGVQERDVEDLTQDVFIAVHRRFGEFDPSRPARPWLFAFAFRAASNYKRLARHRREFHVERETSAPPAQERALEHRQRCDRLLEALATLDFEHRTAIVAVDIDQIPAVEVARSLDIPLNTLYSRVRNGRKKLRAALSGRAPTRRKA